MSTDYRRLGVAVTTFMKGQDYINYKQEQEQLLTAVRNFNATQNTKFLTEAESKLPHLSRSLEAMLKVMPDGPAKDNIREEYARSIAQQREDLVFAREQLQSRENCCCVIS